MLHALEETPGKVSRFVFESWRESERVQGFSVEPYVEVGEDQNVAP